MATCEYRRVNRSISKSTTRSMARLPGHCHRLHPADRLLVGPLLPGGIPATAPPARRPYRRGPGPPLPRPGRPAPGRYANALRREPQALGLFRNAADQIGLALLGTLVPPRPTYPNPLGHLATGPGGWPKPPEWLKVWIPYRTGISAFRDRATESLMPAVNTRRVSEFLAARSFRHCRCMAGFGRSEHDHLCPRPETHLTYMINLALTTKSFACCWRCAMSVADRVVRWSTALDVLDSAPQDAGSRAARVPTPRHARSAGPVAECPFRYDML
jgi:hypothetical protein